jgi:CubicO group peptidase (beta-lactamase class C family)
MLAAVATTAIAQQPPSRITRPDVETFADSFFVRYLREYPEPSLAVVVVTGDSILLMKGYGREDEQQQVDPAFTLFNVASLSKLVVATAAMQLVEQGHLTLNGDIGGALGRVRIRDTGPPITLRHLLSHTSGLEGPFLREVVADARQLIPLGEYFARHQPRRGAAPGAMIRYSNYGAALAGYLVEELSGESFHAYAERHIFGPLGMTRSSFRQPPPLELTDRIATAGAGAVPNVLLPYPAGSMVSTPADMGRFMMAHLNGGRVGAARILADSSVQLMHAAQWRADSRVPGVGLGFFESNIGDEPGLFHTGARIHFSLLYLYPRQRVGVFIVHAMRQGGTFQTLRQDFVRAFTARYFPHAPPSARDDSGAPLRAAEFAGVYRPHLLPTTTIERAADLFSDTRVRVRPDGRLEIKIPAGPKLSLLEIDDDLYRATDGPQEGLRIAFQRDAQGRVRRMSMSGNTQDPITFERLTWYERGTLHAMLLAAAFLLFAGGAVTEIVAAVLRIIRRRQRDLGPAPARRTWIVAVIACVFVLATPLSVAVTLLALTRDDTSADALRVAVTVGCTLLLAAMAVGIALVPLSVRVWVAGHWSTLRRLYFYALGAAAVVAAPLLFHYHLLGYWL